MFTSLDRPRTISTLFTTGGLSYQFSIENLFRATLIDIDKEPLLGGLNIRKKELSVKQKRLQNRVCFFMRNELISFMRRGQKKENVPVRITSFSFQGDFFQPFNDLYIILELDSIDRVILFEGDSINGWTLMNEIVQNPSFLFGSDLFQNI
jgi:hypothetical protein